MKTTFRAAVAALALALAGSALAQTTTAKPSMTVVNTPENPVPVVVQNPTTSVNASVSGTVAVSNFPGTQKVTVDPTKGRIIHLAGAFEVPAHSARYTGFVDTSDCRILSAWIVSDNHVGARLMMSVPDAPKTPSGEPEFLGAIEGTPLGNYVGPAHVFLVNGAPVVSPLSAVSIDTNDYAASIQDVWLYCGR